MGKVKVKVENEEKKEKKISPNDIRNKTIRRMEVLKMKKEKAKEKKAERKRRKTAGEEPKKPHTIESLRVKDETVLDNTKANEEKIEEVNIDIATDEFGDYFKMTYEPKVLITFADNPVTKTRAFGIELSRIIPNSLTRYRNRSSLKKIVLRAKERGFTDVLVINEDRKQPNGLLVTHLPDGPTAYFRMSNVKITKELKKSHKEFSSLRPEVILNNFTTRLGTTISRMLASLFHYSPEFKGRRAVTFHNQRDYIFFRHHRYEFKENGKPYLRELGPRFTLRLEYLQQGTFDTILGEYEWIKANRRHELESNRRKFHL
ncbi:hypothetical protein AAG570_013615 [Ranatra chinensis]|uniref:Brix domain-containing protein n=1 Tax=Ranatra chinensis TaxID=642074 RepID=A0ABD0YDD8_9HEMI